MIHFIKGLAVMVLGPILVATWLWGAALSAMQGDWGSAFKAFAVPPIAVFHSFVALFAAG